MQRTQASNDDFERRRAAVVALVAAHGRLDDNHTGALWLATKKGGVWLLEVVPSMPADARVDEPLEFLPSHGFRYALHLFAGREEDFHQAVDRNPRFARLVADGMPIPGPNDVTTRLQNRARRAAARIEQ